MLQIKRKIVILLVFGFVFFNLSYSRYKELNDFIDYIKTKKGLKIKFEQRNYSYMGESQMEFKGTIWYKPDNNFRIEYYSPEKEVIITSKNKFMNYNFLTEEKMEGNLEDIVFISPFKLLINVDEFFEITQTSDNEYELESKNEKTKSVKNITLMFEEKIYPDKMIIEYISGNFVVYEFKKLIRQNIENKYFNFNTIKKLFKVN